MADTTGDEWFIETAVKKIAELQSDHRAIMRAAHDLCLSARPFNQHTSTEVRVLWALCKDFKEDDDA